MRNTGRVVHFEINADDPARACRFYERVFGWNTKKWEGPTDYWLVETGRKDEQGINGAIQKRTRPGASVYNTVDVVSVNDCLRKIEENGGKAVTKKTAVPGVGYFAYVTDTEGNVFGIMEEDTSAR